MGAWSRDFGLDRSGLKMILGVGHIGIAVKDIEKTLDSALKVFDLPIPAIRDITERKMKVALMDIHGLGLEFIQDYSEDGEFANFVKERGNAIHHFCLLTDDIEADAQALEQKGVKFAIRKPTVGLRGKRIIFTKADALDGIPVELSEP
jgi:methylmalonyl-CoA/ethylmalonyl-CoA epimerase